MSFTTEKIGVTTNKITLGTSMSSGQSGGEVRRVGVQAIISANRHRDITCQLLREEPIFRSYMYTLLHLKCLGWQEFLVGQWGSAT